MIRNLFSKSNRAEGVSIDAYVLQTWIWNFLVHSMILGNLMYKCRELNSESFQGHACSVAGLSYWKKRFMSSGQQWSTEEHM